MTASTKRSFLMMIILVSTSLTKSATESCSLNSDCKNYPYYQCSDSVCVHKDIFPLIPMEIIGIILLTLLSMMATTAGVGGGAIVVPLSLIFLKFETKEAVALANGLVLFNGFVKFLNGLRKKHPVVEYRTIVDYNVVLLFLPSVLLGSVMGSVVSPTIPEFLQILGLVLVLLNAFFKGLKKSNALWRKENEILKQKKKVEEERNLDEEVGSNTDKKVKAEGQMGAREKNEISNKFRKIENQIAMRSNKTLGGVTNGGGSRLRILSENFDPEKIGESSFKKEKESGVKFAIAANSDSNSSKNSNAGKNGLVSKRSFNNSFQMNLLTDKKGQVSTIGGMNNDGLSQNEKISMSKIEDLNRDLEEIRLKNKKISELRYKEVSHEGTNPVPVSLKDSLDKKIKEIEGSNFNIRNFPFILLVLLTSLLVTFLRGGKGFKSVINAEKCSPLDWSIFLAYFITIIAFSLIGSRIVISHQKLKEKANFEIPKNERKIDRKFIITSNIFGILIGFISANIGIGGGLIITPLLLSYDFPPEVVSYTGMYLVFWNKLLSTFVFILSGSMPIFYMLFIGFFLVLGVFLVEWKVGNFIKKRGRQSLVSYAFVGVVLVSFFLVVYSGYRSVKGHIDGEIEKGILEFGNFCGE